jgi:hypothetical protein
MHPRPTPRKEVMIAKALNTLTAMMAVSPLAAPICSMIWFALVRLTPGGMVPRITSSHIKYITNGIPLPITIAWRAQ